MRFAAEKGGAELIEERDIRISDHGRSVLADAAALRETFWQNGGLLPAALQSASLVTAAQVEDASRRLERFAPYIARAFPETAQANGIIESPLRAIGRMRQWLGERGGKELRGSLLLKMDSHLPISGSVKARGGIYEVLKRAETLALRAGLLAEGGDYRLFDTPTFKNFLGKYTVQVGSTGNLGLSIGIISARLGFRVIVHMSADAKQWKKDLLRAKGAVVKEYTADYCAAVERGRAESKADPNSYFVDDEKSLDLFLGYSVAGRRLRAQLEARQITVDEEHPLFVYLPCGIGGAPGGIAYGLKQEYGDYAHCFFVEPVHACCMLLGMATKQYDRVCVGDFGIDGKTAADGLAVGRPSALVGRIMERLLSGICTVHDERLYLFMKALRQTEDIFIEPSACAAFAPLLQEEQLEKYIAAKGLMPYMDNAVHIAWATGGGMVPADSVAAYLAEADSLREAAQ